MAYQETPLREHRTYVAVGGPVASIGGAYEAFWLLYCAFIAAPIIAGVDKFFNVLTNWGQYASGPYASVFGGNIPAMMHTVGVIEIIAGLIVAWRPRIGGVIVAVWLAGIVINLLILPGFFDIALRDFGLMMAALALSRLSTDSVTP